MNERFNQLQQSLPSELDCKIKNKKTGKEKMVKIRNNIFRDMPNISNTRKFIYNSMVKIVQWQVDKVSKITIDDRRFNRIHKVVKVRIVHNALKFLEKVIGKYIIKSSDDIPKKWYNNHLRILYNCWELSIRDMFEILTYNQIKFNGNEKKRKKFLKDYPTAKKFVDKSGVNKQRSWTSRMMLMRLYMTEVLEDTADREMMNFFMMRVTHEMMMFYGVDVNERAKVPLPGQFPVYYSKTGSYPEYFIKGRNLPVWNSGGKKR